MRKFICGAVLCLGTLVPAVGQKVLHGAGDPRLQSPIPSCVFDKAYIDDTTGNQYTAAGYPCKWTTGSTNGFIYPSAVLAADGVTDDTVAFQAQVNAAEAAGTVLMLPPNKTILLTGTISISGVVLWQGNNTTILSGSTTPLQYMFGGSGITKLDIGGITFQGNSNTVTGFLISGGTNQNISIHNNTFTGMTGCPANPNLWSIGQIIINGANYVRIRDNNFLSSGCSSYWNLGNGPSGIAIESYYLPSYDWDISGNYVSNTYNEFGFLLFNLFESTVHDNDIQNVILNSAAESQQSGYGIAIYGTAICGGAVTASPSGLSRTSNVVTINFSSTCSPALVVGDHITVTGSTSVGGTLFDGAYTVATGGTTSVTATLDTGVSLANDTGGGGIPGYSPRMDRVHDNLVKNTAGMGVYFANVGDSTTSNNVFNHVCQSINDAALPCGFVALNGPYRVSADGNVGAGSVKDGIVSVNGAGVSVFGNDVANASDAGLRLRGADYSETWFGNTALGGTYGFKADSGAYADVLLGNASSSVSGYHMSLGTANSVIAVGNNMNGAALTGGVDGIYSANGYQNLLALNYAQKFTGTAFYIAGDTNDLVALNYSAYGSGSIGFNTNLAYYTLVTNNYISQGATGFADGSGHSNVIRDNYVSASIPSSGFNGLAWGNQLDGAVGGVYPLGSCTLVAGTCTITTAEVQSTDSGKIYCTRGSTGSNPGFPFASSITAGTSFVVTSTNASDTGNVGCRIQH